MLYALKRLARSAGYELSISRRLTNMTSPYSALAPVIDLDRLSAMAETIPGMVKPRSGEILFSLCLFQQEQGDVVEIGSWQGRSTSYLAHAVEQSGNGRLHAIDHFKGNEGKSGAYRVGAADLSDLKANFLANMGKMKAAVSLLDMPTEEAAKQLVGTKIRFLFIDGDHTPEGVRRDVELFLPLLIDGAIIAFDDYTPRFPGVVEQANKLIPGTTAVAYENTAILRYRKLR